MIISVSILTIRSGAATPSSLVNLSIARSSIRPDTWPVEGRGSRVLLLAGGIVRIDVADAPRAVAVEFHDRLVGGPGVVIGAWLHDADRAGRERMGLRLVE